MPTVAHLVKSLVEKKPFVAEALTKGLINYAALAEELSPDIERELQKSVKASAIIMALRRYGESQKDKFKTSYFNFKESDVTIKSGLFEITVEKSNQIPTELKKLYELVDFGKGDFLTITQGLYEVTILSNNKHMKATEKIFKNEKVVKKIEKLSSLTVKIPLDAIHTPGMFYIITKALSWENINLLEIVSTLTELTFILNEDDVSRAFETLKDLVE
jgi:aspartokinase|tara:strand:- start:1039 stop:1689 length:651 start_codon:yes stop_codon:yes gene_type:complete